MTKPEREGEARSIIARGGADTGKHFNQVEAVNFGITFPQQAERWLYRVQTRKRNPINGSGSASYLNKRLNPSLGDVPLSSVNILVVKGLVTNKSILRESTERILTRYTM